MHMLFIKETLPGETDKEKQEKDGMKSSKGVISSEAPAQRDPKGRSGACYPYELLTQRKGTGFSHCYTHLLIGKSHSGRI